MLNERDYIDARTNLILQLNCPMTIYEESFFLSLITISYRPTATHTLQRHCLSVTQADGYVTDSVFRRPLKVETRVRSHFSLLDHWL